MRVTIIGAGAIGLLIGAYLRNAGHEVRWVVRRHDQMLRLREQGFYLDGSSIGALQVDGMDALFDQHRDSEVVIWTVKQTQLNDDILEWGRHAFADHAVWIAFQNGIGHHRLYERWKQNHEMIYAVTTEAAFKQSDTHVFHTGKGQTRFGFWNVQTESSWLEQWVKNWNDSGLDGQAVSRIEPFMMRKWIVNCVINPLTACYRVHNGELLKQKELFSKAEDVFNEIRLVMTDEKIQNDCQLSSSEMWQMIVEVCERTASNQSSMFQDVQNGKQTEWAALNGELLRMAQERALHLPVNKWMQQQLL